MREPGRALQVPRPRSIGAHADFLRRGTHQQPRVRRCVAGNPGHARAVAHLGMSEGGWTERQKAVCPLIWTALKRLLPAPSQCAVELDQGEGFPLLRGYQVKLCREEVGVVGEYLEVGRRSTLIAEAG